MQTVQSAAIRKLMLGTVRRVQVMNLQQNSSSAQNAEQMLKDWGYSFVSVKPPKYLEEFDKKQQRLDLFS